MGKRLVDIDPFSGVKTYHHYDHQTKVTTIERVQNVEPLLDRAKNLQNTDYQQKGIKRCWWHAAMIPNIVIEKWLNEHGVNALDPNDMPKVKRLLNDPDYRYLRTGRGKL